MLADMVIMHHNLVNNVQKFKKHKKAPSPQTSGQEVVGRTARVRKGPLGTAIYYAPSSVF